MGLMPIHAGPKPWAHRVLSFVRASGCRASIVPPVLPLGVSMSMTNTVDRWGGVRTAYWQRGRWALVVREDFGRVGPGGGALVREGVKWRSRVWWRLLVR